MELVDVPSGVITPDMYPSHWITLPGFRYDPKIAEAYMNFFPAYCRYSRGRWKGSPMHMPDWIRPTMMRFFGTVNANNKRQYREIFIGVPKKNGKSELAAAIALLFLCADGEPSPEVYGVAVDKEQAGVVFGAAEVMVWQQPKLKEAVKVLSAQRRMRHYSNHGFYKVLGGESEGKQGPSPHCVIFDEIHEQRQRDLWDAVASPEAGMAREQPLVMALTTAGENTQGAGFDLWERALRVQQGKSENPRMLVCIYGCTKDADWKNPKVWQAVNPSWGEIVQPDVVRDRVKVLDSDGKPAEIAEFRRMRLNTWIEPVHADAWMPMRLWDDCGADIKDLWKGKQSHGGLDLGEVGDLAAFARVWMYDDLLHIWVMVWIPIETLRERQRVDKRPYERWVEDGFIRTTEGFATDFDQVQEDIANLHKADPLVDLGFDQWKSGKVVGHLEDEESFKDENGQPLAKPIVCVDVKQSTINLNEATREMKQRTLEGRLRHDRNPVLRMAIENAVPYRDSNGYMKLDKRKSTARIDPAVASIIAIDRLIRNEPEEEREELPPPPKTIKPSEARERKYQW